jgi:quercetin dioxygenase-like cupin family protein
MRYKFNWNEFNKREVPYLKGRPESPKLQVRIMSATKIMVTRIEAQKGAYVPRHHHEAEQIILVLKGKIRSTTGESGPDEIGPGEIWVVPSNVPHSVEYIEDTEAIEVVSPIRLDNFEGYVISHTFLD